MKLEFKNEVEKATLKIYDYVGQYDGVNTGYIEEELNKAENKPLDIYINSYGGEVFEGFAIYNMLKRYAGQKNVIIDGIAASIASVIALAGDSVKMNKASMFMIHNASGVCIGNAEEMKKVVNALEQINEVIKGVYKERVNLTDEELTELMNNETFLTAEQCLEYGFCDEIIEEEQDDETKVNAENSMKLLQNNIEERIKVLNSLKEVSKDGGQDPVADKETFFNKQSHWDFLRRKEI